MGLALLGRPPRALPSLATLPTCGRPASAGVLTRSACFKSDVGNIVGTEGLIMSEDTPVPPELADVLRQQFEIDYADAGPKAPVASVA